MSHPYAPHDGLHCDLPHPDYPDRKCHRAPHHSPHAIDRDGEYHVWLDEYTGVGRKPAWAMPAEPGPEVTAVVCDCHAQVWYRDEVQWVSRGYPLAAYRWPGLLANHSRLTLEESL